ncbi:hypothetical protein [Streptomyces sp. NPDC056361]|uniref:hypothetical protein n=1 Tax=Streptomyces sp. NPDC056361 TaxID=3345795 RepID=UPI0035DFC393
MLNGMPEITAKRAAALLTLGAGLAVATVVVASPAPATTTQAGCRLTAVAPAEASVHAALFVTPTCR